MRLIDADALKETFVECSESKLVERARIQAVLGTAIDLIDDATTVGGWISVKDRMPENGKHVLVTCEIRLLNGSKKRYVCVAFFAEQYSVPEGKYPEDEDCYDYCEEDDEYYLKEGWYEVIHNWDDYSSIVIYDFVTHWMLLPEPAKEEG